jgi:acetyltransferase-like isoleucine patch superfamily enzyme
MASAIKNIYHSICRRIYSVGKLVVESKEGERLRIQAEAGEQTVFYNGSGLTNLSGKKEKISIGKNCHIYGQLVVYNYAGEISIGDNCSLGDMSRIVSGKKIEIGNRVMIAHNVNIIDNNSHPKDAKLRHEDFIQSYSSGMKEYDLQAKEIIIEDDVWIGFNSIILKGVRIGRGAIIGAGSVVVKDVEPWTVNVGNPLRCVEKLEPVNF